MAARAKEEQVRAGHSSHEPLPSSDVAWPEEKEVPSPISDVMWPQHQTPDSFGQTATEEKEFKVNCVQVGSVLLCPAQGTPAQAFDVQTFDSSTQTQVSGSQVCECVCVCVRERESERER